MTGNKFNLKLLLARGPELIEEEKVAIKEIPVEELGLTGLYILMAGIWVVFADDIFNWLMGVGKESALLQTTKAVNFISTTALVLYLILRRSRRRHRRAQEALRVSQERFESVALATTDAIWDLNLDNRVIWWSEGLQKLFGYSPDDASKFGWWRERIHPADRDRVTDAITTTVESGIRAWTGEYRFRREDDTYALVMDRGFVINDGTGKPARLVGGLSDITERHAAEMALESSRQQLRALALRLQRLREEERATVAREIHDGLGQMLTAIKLDLDWLESELESHRSDRTLNPLLERIVQGQETTCQAIETVQRIATNLRPPLLDELGLLDALRDEAKRFQQRSDIVCKLQLPAEDVPMQPEIAIALFRVFQEALTNVARHAKAGVVNISLTSSKQEVILVVEDDGKGIPREALANPHSLGLLGMVERATALGGRVAVTSVSPRGTRVTLELPFQFQSSPDTVQNSATTHEKTLP